MNLCFERRASSSSSQESPMYEFVTGPLAWLAFVGVLRRDHRAPRALRAGAGLEARPRDLLGQHLLRRARAPCAPSSSG
ncbi:MAG: hypothetical protein MZV70_19965 [Desulfobacterales bacterium]|nr:hypothetical protein [Desulfobacterales bacterium]